MFDLIPFGRNDKSIMSYFDNLEKTLFRDFWGGITRFRTDIVDKGDKYVLQAELPGFDKKEIKIDIQDNYLTISAGHNEEKETKKDDFVRRERKFGSYSRGFDISDIEAEKIAASYNNGILELELPKMNPVPKLPGRRIDID